VTIVATGSIEVAGETGVLTAAAADGMLLYAGTGIHISGASGTFRGIIYAPNGLVRESGGQNTFPSGGIWAQSVELTGGHNSFGTP
jgi:hypothetical protein